MTTSSWRSHRLLLRCLLALGTTTLAAPRIHGQTTATSPSTHAAAAVQQAPSSSSQPQQPAAAGASTPELDAFVKKVRDRIRLDSELQIDYTYLEKRRDVKVSRLGKVSVGPMRTFEVYPSPKPGRTYKRLIAIDGKPLDPAELERRDADHRAHMIALAEQEQHETAADKAKRLEKEAKDKRERDEIIDDAFAVFAIKVEGREVRDGHQVVVASLTPRKDAKTKSDVGKWLKKFKARVWVDEADAQLVHIEAVAMDDISIGWGLVGRVHDGSKFTFTRRKVNDEVWLPAEATFDATGRTLLFRGFNISTTTTYSDYKKFSVDTSVTYSTPKSDDKDEPNEP